MPEKLNWKSKSLLAIIAGSLVGCAVLEPTTPEKAVEKKATEYWQQRIQGKLDKAYLFASPSFRAARSVEQYKNRFGSGAAIKAAEVQSVTCETAKCSVRMKLKASVALPMVNLNELTTYVEEAWVLEDGSWWRYEEL